jgi:hypothetical protein
MNAINPVVSVIMPVYNVEAFVAEAVDPCCARPSRRSS